MEISCSTTFKYLIIIGLSGLFFVYVPLKHVVSPLYCLTPRSHFSAVVIPRNDHLRILSEFHRLAEKYNISYFMYSGTLLGSVRHHGRIPWDDDADLLVNMDQRDIMKKAIDESKKIQIYFSGWLYRDRWKLVLRVSSNLPVEWQFPFVDIWFYHAYDDKLDVYGAFKTWHTFHRKDIFPLTLRPFEDLQLYAPRRSFEIIRQTFPEAMDECMSNGFNHSRDMPRPSCSIPCKSLSHLFPFVKRHSGVELLVLNGTIIKTYKTIHDN